MSPSLEKFTSVGANCSDNIKSHAMPVPNMAVAEPLEQDGNGGSFNEMISRIETAFGRSNSSVDVDELWKVLEDYKSKQDEWAKYAYYDMRKYKRNLVAEYDKFNVMIICWGPGSQSCIHDHSGSHCFMKILDGELIESRFAWPDPNRIAEGQEMCHLSDTLMKRDDVIYINGKFLFLSFSH